MNKSEVRNRNLMLDYANGASVEALMKKYQLAQSTINLIVHETYREAREALRGNAVMPALKKLRDKFWLAHRSLLKKYCNGELHKRPI